MTALEFEVVFSLDVRFVANPVDPETEVIGNLLIDSVRMPPIQEKLIDGPVFLKAQLSFHAGNVRTGRHKKR